MSACHRVARGNLGRHHRMLSLLSVIVRAVRLAAIASVELPALDEVAQLIIVQLFLL